MTNSDEFLNASKIAKEYRPYITQYDLQQLYGYYKQAVVGDINIVKPTSFVFKDHIKWEIWNLFKGISKEDAELKYILYVKEILNRPLNK